MFAMPAEETIWSNTNYRITYDRGTNEIIYRIKLPVPFVIEKKEVMKKKLEEVLK